MKIAYALSILLTSTVSFAQGTKHRLPENVQDAFSRDFSAVTNVKWSMEDGDVEINFRIDSKEMSATYDSSGTLLETEEEIKARELPTQTVNYVHENYKGATIKEASRLKKQDGTIVYEAEVKGRDLLFDQSGGFLDIEED